MIRNSPLRMLAMQQAKTANSTTSGYFGRYTGTLLKIVYLLNYRPESLEVADFAAF